MEERRLKILYGSQTGTAQEVAERIWRESKWYNFAGPVLAMDEYPIQDLIYERIVVFVCSTTGQGEEPDNMKRFWKFLLRRNLPLDSLQGLQFAVLGLGDSSYQRFNYTAKKLSQRLMQLGGSVLQGLGLADDQHDLGYDFTVDPWIKNLWQRLAELYPLPQNLEPYNQNLLCLPRWHVRKQEEYSKNTEYLKHEGMEKQDSLLDKIETNKKSSLASVLSNVRTTGPSHFQDVRLIQFSAPGLSYLPGDVLSVVPHNLPSNVDALFTLLATNKANLTPDTVLHISSRDSDIPVPVHLKRAISVRECAEKHWDLNAVPRRYLFQLLSHFTTSDLENEKLVEFTTPAGQEELYNYANRPRRTVLETLLDFPHASENIPLEYLFEVFQPIRPRAFSIASSPAAHKEELHILVAVVNYKTKLVKRRLGLCSNWMAGLKAGDQVPVSIRTGSFKFPTDLTHPVIMIGPGTGVAPFRSYINERVAIDCASNKTLVLFFGCRNVAADFHCKDEWLKLEANEQLKIFCAFSRDQEHKIYVQHILREQGSLLWDLITNHRAHIFLAGSSNNMPKAVVEAFIGIIAKHNAINEEDATKLFDMLETTGRYQCETWA